MSCPLNEQYLVIPLARSRATEDQSSNFLANRFVAWLCEHNTCQVSFELCKVEPSLVCK